MTKGRNRRRRIKIGGNIHELIQKSQKEKEFASDMLVSIALDADTNEIDSKLVEWFKKAFHVREIVNVRPMFRWSLSDFDKDERRARRLIIDQLSNECDIKPEEIINFWGTFLDNKDIPDSVAPKYKQSKEKSKIMAPLSEEEIMDAEWSTKSTYGPDNVSVKKWMLSPYEIRALFYTLILKNGRFPPDMLALHVRYFGRKNSTKPEQFEPIIIPTVPYRQLSRILRYRLESENVLRHFQAVRVENLMITVGILKDSIAKKKPVYISVLNFKKSSESIRHDTIFKSLSDAGAPSDFIDFLKKVFDGRFVLTGNRSAKPFSIRRGVPQGDPLSESLLVLAFQYIARAAKQGGYTFSSKKVHGLAHRGQILLFADTETSLRNSLNTLEPYIEKAGLEVSDSSRVFSPTKDVSHLSVSLKNGTRIAPLGNERWRCFGREFQGMELVPSEEIIKRDLNKIQKASIKPHQCLTLIRDLITHFLTADIFIDVHSGKQMNALHTAVRNAVLSITNVSQNYSNSLIHASNKNGGYAIPCIICKITRLWKFIFADLRSSCTKAARAAVGLPWLKEQEKWLRSIGDCRSGTHKM